MNIRRVTKEYCETHNINPLKEFKVESFDKNMTPLRFFGFTIVVDITKEDYKKVILDVYNNDTFYRDARFFKVSCEGRVLGTFDLKLNPMLNNKTVKSLKKFNSDEEDYLIEDGVQL